MCLICIIILCCCCGKKDEETRYKEEPASPHGTWDDVNNNKSDPDVFAFSKHDSDELQPMDMSPTTGFPPGCPVDVNYNGEWAAARIVSQEDDGSYTVDWGEEGMVTRGVHPADVRERSEGLFCIGDNVLAWHNSDFYPAVITERNAANGTYDVRWEDGSATKGLTSPELRLDHKRHGVVPVIDEDVASPNHHLVGQTVDVFWNGAWSMGTVRNANTDGSVLIQWVDGTYTDGVDPTLIRPVGNPIDSMNFDQK